MKTPGLLFLPFGRMLAQFWQNGGTLLADE